MQQSGTYNNQRKTQRVGLSLPIQISFGSQITLTGQIKDLSLKSAFIVIKSSIYMQLNDEISFAIQYPSDSPAENVQGSARISRLAIGEGIAIYFTKLDEGSSDRLRKLVDA